MGTFCIIQLYFNYNLYLDGPTAVSCCTETTFEAVYGK